MTKISLLIILVCISFNFQLLQAENITVEDFPNDDGSALHISWEKPEITENIGYCYIYRQDQGSGEFQYIGNISDMERTDFIDNDPRYPLSAGMDVIYKIVAVDLSGNEIFEIGISDKFSPRASFFNFSKVNSFIATLFVFAALVVFLNIAKTGRGLYIRRIAGLDALDESVGRATEMGKPVLYVPGLSSMSDVATIASINILGPIAKKVAEYETKIIVPNADPIVYTITHEVVKESYLEAGRPDAFDTDQVFFITDMQFAFVAAVNGIILREKPATNLFLGMFWAESLLLAETGNQIGAIQIAGTDSVTQLPFFITACDYTLIGEELYAASAYLSRDPVLVGTLKAQDLEKVVILFFLVVGSIIALISTLAFKSDIISRFIFTILNID